MREVHRAYLEAGAEVIIANTFATSPLLFATVGRDDDVATIDRAAVRLAREAVAAAGGTAAVAGSVSTMQPVLAGDDRTDRSRHVDRRPRCGSATGARRARWPRPASISWSWR